MSKLEHKESCPIQGENINDWSRNDICSCSNFQEWLPHIAKDIFWFNIQDVGSYQGSIYAIGTFEKQFLIYEGYYGSCSGCGAWGEGGEPESQEEVLKSCTLLKTKEDAIRHLLKLDRWDKPDTDVMLKALDEVESFLK